MDYHNTRLINTSRNDTIIERVERVLAANMGGGFFETFLVKMTRAINEKFSAGSIIETRHIRKALEIPSTDRSKTIFISRGLQKLHEFGFVDYVGRNSPKKYKLSGNISIIDLQSKILGK